MDSTKQSTLRTLQDKSKTKMIDTIRDDMEIYLHRVLPHAQVLVSLLNDPHHLEFDSRVQKQVVKLAQLEVQFTFFCDF